jgi:hypothetical protein
MAEDMQSVQKIAAPRREYNPPRLSATSGNAKSLWVLGGLQGRLARRTSVL